MCTHTHTLDCPDIPTTPYYPTYQTEKTQSFNSSAIPHINRTKISLYSHGIPSEGTAVAFLMMIAGRATWLQRCETN